MRIISAVTMTTGALVSALILGIGSQPAEAGKLCDRAGLGRPCVQSSDLKARINLKEAGKDGRLLIRDANNATAVAVDGGSANLTNLLSNVENRSNGLVKAWAYIRADGTIAACWRCNTDPSETLRLLEGAYEVDFTPLATDITGRPWTASIDLTDDDASPGAINVAEGDGDANSVLVVTPGIDGTVSDRPFILIIH